MVYDLRRRFFKGILCFLFLTIQLPTAFSADDRDSIQVNGRAKLMESCSVENCEENLTCNKNFICQCQSGYRIVSNNCVPLAEENEKCERHEDCGIKLLCIHGICRKPYPSNDLLTLANVCLGIIAAVLIVALISTIIKCLIRYDGSRAFENHGRTSASLRILRSPFPRNESQVRRVMDEKPPSYEECLRVTPENTLAEPPPYTIAAKAVSPITVIPNNSISQGENLPVLSQPNSTPLNVQALCRETRSISNKHIQTENSQEIPNGRNV